jgi:hypothetical protein
MTNNRQENGPISYILGSLTIESNMHEELLAIGSWQE